MKYLPPKYILERIIYKSVERGLSDKIIQRLLGIMSSLNLNRLISRGFMRKKRDKRKQKTKQNNV